VYGYIRHVKEEKRASRHLRIEHKRQCEDGTVIGHVTFREYLLAKRLPHIGQISYEIKIIQYQDVIVQVCKAEPQRLVIEQYYRGCDPDIGAPSRQEVFFKPV
jgi:hypothetical protein